MPENSIHIKTAEIHHAPILAEVIQKSFQTVATRFELTPENCPKHPSNCTKQWIVNDFSRGVSFYILMDRDVPAGCVGIEKANENLCYMERLAVLPEYRRKGLGKMLADHVIQYAEMNNIKEIGIGIIADDIELKEWYARAGFTENGTKRFPHLPFEVLFMKYEI